MTQRHSVQHDTMMLITTNVSERRPLFMKGTYAREAIETLYSVQAVHPFFLYGFVIMPDHCHFLLRVPPPGSISKIMNVYKGIVSLNIGAGPVWQRRFHIEIVHKPTHALDYIHMNPVQAGLVKQSTDYPWSSASGQWDVCTVDIC